MIAVSQPATALQAMDDWNTRTHTKSGLVDRVLESDISEDEAADMTLAFLAQWVPANRRCAAIPSARTVASWHVTCRCLNAFSTTATWMSVL